MERRLHSLLVLFEGLPATVVQSQVFSRLTWLEREGNSTFDVLAFAQEEAIYEASLKRGQELARAVSGTVYVEKGVRASYPFSLSRNRRLLRQWLTSGARRYDILHARTDYAAAVAGPLCRELDIPMIWDCRGDAAAELEDRWRGRLLMKPLIWFRAIQIRREGRIAAANCDAASFVSTKLQAMWLPLLGNTPSVVLPCSADSRIFYFDEETRRRVRECYGFADDAIVFVYSGSLAHYQGFDEALHWFEHAHRALPQARLFVATPEASKASAMLQHCDPEIYRVETVAFNDVNGVLNAADYAFMLRPELRTNLSAFPTKFAEYGLCGLNVIMRRSVPDCYDIAATVGNLVTPDVDMHALSSSCADRRRIMCQMAQLLSHDALGATLNQLYHGLQTKGRSPDDASSSLD